tara:strand:- start:428 stop:946 length:519 start_codon:yes stop_codon:yes gene_type:complete
MFHDKEGNLLLNNDERMIFYCKGVIETVRKLGWAPDIIHCQGWFSSLIPMYIKKVYAEEPLFENVKVIYSVFDNSFDGIKGGNLADKLLFENIEQEDVAKVQSPTTNNLHRFAIDYSDAVVEASDGIEKELLSYIHCSGKPFMKYPGEDYVDAYEKFYNELIGQEEAAIIEN